MTQPWPWPTDDRLDRRSRICHMWRDLAHDLDAIAQTGQAVEFDDVLRAYGQHWALDEFSPDTEDDPEALLTARELAIRLDVSESTVRNWVARWPLEAVARNTDGVALYRLGDVLQRRKSVP